MVVRVTVVTTVVLVAGAYDIWPKTSSGRMLSRDCAGMDVFCLVLWFGKLGEPGFLEDDVEAVEMGGFSVVRTPMEDGIRFP